VRGISYRVPPRQVSAGFRLVIDSLGVNAAVVQLGLDPGDVPQVPNHAAKVAWYDFSATPGTGSNAVLAGHVRWAGDHGVFADLDELQNGDLIRLRWLDGTQSVYEVFVNLVVNVRDPDSIHVMSPTVEDTITLITCGGTFVADNDNPLGGDFTHRSVVQARLVEPSVAALSR
jgi:LPXTG-site transpeptidase (sortase) family protein